MIWVLPTSTVMLTRTLAKRPRSTLLVLLSGWSVGSVVSVVMAVSSGSGFNTVGKRERGAAILRARFGVKERRAFDQQLRA